MNFLKRFNVGLLVLQLVLPLLGFSQRKLVSNPAFNFKEGIYFTLQDYKENRPSVLFSQFCDKSGKPIYDFVVKNTLYYKAEGTEIKSIKQEELFGYATKGDFYIKVNYNGIYFARLVVIGSMSHFVCEVRNNVYPTFPDSPGGAMTTFSLEQFIFDYDSGLITPFDRDVFAKLLQRDEELYGEYSILSKKKKKDLMFLYLRKYNERHPVSFPL